MKKTLHKYFVPHKGNDYHPHILHTKRALGYSAFFLALKGLAVAFAFMLPAQAFLTPDVLAGQKAQIFALVNEVRARNGLKPLAAAAKLDSSSAGRVDDMLALGYFSHQGPDGHNLTYFLNKAGYSYYVAGENLAMGFSSAADVVDAWEKSPTHYANLVDRNFTEEGLGLSVGDYQGVPTVFVAEHFGLPKAGEPAAAPVVEKTPPPSEPVNANVPAPEAPVKNPEPVTAVQEPVAPPAVAGTETSEKAPVPAAGETIAVVPENSSVKWSSEGNKTKIEALVATTGPVKSVTAVVDGREIELKENAPGQFAGSATLPEKPNEVFKVITPPSVIVTAQNGMTAPMPVRWENPKVVSPTPWQRYVQANSWLGAIYPIFGILRWVYIIALAFFAIALAIHLYVVETRKYGRKHHIWLQTGAMLGILAVMIWK